MLICQPLGYCYCAGYSGGAISLAAAQHTLSYGMVFLTPFSHQGLQSIARKYNFIWQKCAKSVAGVARRALYRRLY